VDVHIGGSREEIAATFRVAGLDRWHQLVLVSRNSVSQAMRKQSLLHIQSVVTNDGGLLRPSVARGCLSC
jgi:hypothetical protein